ncbi:MAG: hypothetical protein A3G24_13545 [Betaproteobacteria bacterium RIFCSPLOWO2_12_FULL_62_13]|nr:MAG: hypothetical protein A3G24_13545 [Betaproteobacteria bacterium RIFCSPLOWO2_12_FULL_62_13]
MISRPAEPTPPDGLTAVTIEDITLWPMAPGSSHSDLRYVLDPKFGRPFAHLRFRKRRLDTASYTAPPSGARGREVMGTALYGGVIFNQFGHFIAESLHRLWALQTNPSLQAVPIIYHTAGRRLIRDAQYADWMLQIFALLQIDTSRIILVEEPMTFERLVVPQQGSQLGLGPVTPDYRSLFPPPRGNAAADAGEEPQRLYVSRSKFLHGGSYLGEPLVEEVLARDGGFRILHPQDNPIADVVQLLEAAHTAVFVEGSALHFLELCRKTPRNIFVIGRRRQNAFQGYFDAMVRKAAANVVLQPVVETLIPLEWMPRRGQPAGQNAPALVDLRDLLQNLSRFCGASLQAPNDLDIRRAQALSLLQVIIDTRSTSSRTPMETLGRLLIDLRRQVNRLDFLPWPPSPVAEEAIWTGDDGGGGDDHDVAAA